MMRSMADPSEPQSRRLRARIALISAAIGALVILTIGTLLNWPGGGEGPGVGASGKRGAAPVPASVAAASAGTCLDWREPDAADIHPASCGQPHLFEVTGKADLSADFTKTAPFPDTDQWEQLKQQRCTQVSSQYLGGRLDPHGRFSVGAFTPSAQSWRNGDRTLHCGLQQPGPSGRLYQFTGRVADLDQSDTHPVGRCLGINGQAVTDPVQDCSEPHAVEITGLVNLGEQFRDFPEPSDQDDFLAARCTDLTAQYAGSRTSAADKGLIVYWDTLSLQSWEAGSRQVNCKVSAQLPDGSGLAPVSGSIRGVVRVNRTPAPQDAAPRERGVPATGQR
jgi:hypothetical protein